MVLIVIDLALKIINHRKKPWQFLRNPWNILDIVTLLIVIGLPAYRSLIFVRFGRVFSGLIGVGSRSILKSAFLAKSAVQKTVMQAQAEAQSRFWDLALKGSNDGLWEWDLSDNTFKLSQRWRELHGYDSHEIEDSYDAWLNCIYPSDRPSVLKALNKHLSGEQSFFSIEYRSRLANGSYGWFAGRGLALRDTNGEPLIMIGSSSNISALRISKKKLEYREKIIRNIFDNVPLLLAVYEQDGKISLANKLFKDTFGDEASKQDNTEIQLQSLSNSTHNKQQLSKILHHEEGTWREIEVKTESGKSLDLAWLNSQLDNQSTILLGQDLTYRHRVENALAQEREFAQVTLRSIGDAVITIDLTGKIETLNPVAEKLTGWSQEESWHQPLNEVVNLYSITTEERRPCLIAGEVNEARLKSWRGRHLLVSKTGQQSVVNGSANVICDRHQNAVGVVLAFRDMTQSYYLEQELSWQATHDGLTGLYNHRALDIKLQELVNQDIDTPYNHIFCYVDLDQLDLVNSIFGYVAGDQLLSYAGQVLKHYFRSAEIIARLGGDEFGVLLPFCSLNRATEMIDEFRSGIKSDKFVWQDQAFTLSANIGLVQWNEANKAVGNILNVGATVCHNSKRGGKNQLEIYTLRQEDIATQYGKQSWLVKINQALVEERFCLFAQKIIPLHHADHPTIYEVLIRMVGEDGELINPGQFLPVAERYNLMPDLDRWVVKNFLKRYWSMLEKHSENCIYTINLSGESLSSESFFSFLKECLSYPGSPASKICFEVTETMAIANLQRATKFIEEIKSLGCLFALDDFGSGMSSLAYLRTLPVDYLKIDGMFVREITTNKVDRTMVESCHRIAHSLGIETIAEYAESERVVERLRTIGIDYAQGFAIAYPQDLETLMEPVIALPN
ncbi:MAG: EAL domain-containing protein [Cyanobacteria bacterium P01_C01_bin.89]